MIMDSLFWGIEEESSSIPQCQGAAAKDRQAGKKGFESLDELERMNGKAEQGFRRRIRRLVSVYGA